MKAPLVFHQLILGVGGGLAKEPAAGTRLGRSYQTSRKHPLIRQFGISEHDRRDAGLHHQMQRHAPACENGYAIAGANSLDRLAVPDAGKSRGGFQFVFGTHRVAGDKLSALGGEDADAGLPVLQRAAESFEGRLLAGKQREEGSRGLRPQRVERHFDGSEIPLV